MGVISPPGMDTATEISTRENLSIWSPANCTLHSGTCMRDTANALISRSLTESLTPRPVSPALSSLRNFNNLSSRSEEHPPDLQSLMRISYAFLCLKQKIQSLIQIT